MKTSPLNNIKVASPCSANWDEMLGDDRKRYCGECKLNVFNLSGMTKMEAENLLLDSEGRVCVRFYRRSDGTVLTQDCPVGWAKKQFLVSIVLPCAVSMLGSFLLEHLLQPRPHRFWSRPLSALTLHKGIVAILFVLELVLFRRPWFAAANVLALLLFLILVNNAKFHSLREPFICQDFEYFTDALKHPRLYLPFLGIGRALAAITGIGGAIIAGMLLESPVPATLVYWGVALFSTAGVMCILLGSRFAPDISCRPVEDLKRLGQLASLWLYGRAERLHRPATPPASPAFQSTASPATGTTHPDVVVVQSESFFDPRQNFPVIKPEILPQFDRLKETSQSHGLLQVPAWGANTVRTEYAFLSALAPAELGIHRFNPYRWFARNGTPTMAGFLKRQGYHTICIHPYPGSFYKRDEVYPRMGFDEFIDISEFSPDDTTGPYVGDCAVADRVREVLDAKRSRRGDAPLFIFVITMENHGPLHLERCRAEEALRYFTQTPPSGCEDLTIYLRHLVNADRMIGMLRETLEHSEREGLICVYGDHLPIMPDVYKALGYPDGASDYVIWSNRKGGRQAMQRKDMDVWDLAGELVRQAGMGK